MISMKTLYNQMRIHPEFRNYVYDWLDFQHIQGLAVHELSRKTLCQLAYRWRVSVGLRPLSSLERHVRRNGVSMDQLDVAYDEVVVSGLPSVDEGLPENFHNVVIGAREEAVLRTVYDGCKVAHHSFVKLPGSNVVMETIKTLPSREWRPVYKLVK